MPPALFASPFARLDLSLDAKEELVRSAHELIDQTQQKYEQFMWKDKSQLNAAIWDQVREREEVRVFHDRRPGADTGVKDMHLLLTVGTIVANLNDAMYGVLNHTAEDMRIKTEYVQDTLLDSAVLETLLEPTPDEPFQSMSVRWFVKGVPLHVRAMSKHRDNVYLEATGMRRLTNGEQIGYHVMHSIAFDKTPRLAAYDRFNMSIVTLWRQESPQRVQAFMTSYIEIQESFMTPFVVKSTADALVSLWKYTHCAQMKKLAWLVRQKNVFNRLGDTGRESVMEGGCSVCGSHSRSARKGLKSACAACSKYTCSKCRVKRVLSIFAPDGQLLKHEMRFCVPCLTVVNRLDAAAVAQDEALSSRSVSRAALGKAMGVTPSSSMNSGGSSNHGGPSRFDNTMWTASTSSSIARSPRSSSVRSGYSVDRGVIL